MKHLFTIVFVLLLLFPGNVLFADSNNDFPWDDEDNGWDYAEPYGLGTQMFYMSAGLYIPLFLYFPEKDNPFVAGLDDDMYSIGGMGSLAWSTFLSDRFSLGFALAGAFTGTPSKGLNVMIPFTGLASYLLRYGAFEFPLTFEAGLVINRLDDEVYFGPIAKPGVSAYWLMNHEWALGFNLKYWWIPEIYFGDNSHKTGFGNFLEFSFSGRYTF